MPATETTLSVVFRSATHCSLSLTGGVNPVFKLAKYLTNHWTDFIQTLIIAECTCIAITRNADMQPCFLVLI